MDFRSFSSCFSSCTQITRQQIELKKNSGSSKMCVPRFFHPNGLCFKQRPFRLVGTERSITVQLYGRPGCIPIALVHKFPHLEQVDHSQIVFLHVLKKHHHRIESIQIIAVEFFGLVGSSHLNCGIV